MPDWSSSMEQTYEFYVVEPKSKAWTDIKQLHNIKSCSINRDLESSTLGSATFNVAGMINECYIRVYLKTIQNGVTEKHPLGTYLVQTPSSTFDGRVENISLDAYTPLIELTEKSPPIGFYIKEGADIMEEAYKLMDENMRGPISKPVTPSTKLSSNFISDDNDNWLNFLTDLVSIAATSKHYRVEQDSDGICRRGGDIIEIPEDILESKDYIDTSNKTKSQDIVYMIETNNEDYKDLNGTLFCSVEGITQHRLDLDEMGRVLFMPNQDITSLTPVWTYTDDNSSILYPEITMNRDIYGIPNVVEVVYTDQDGYFTSRAVNDDPNSPVSTISRGREIVQRVVNPNIHGKPTQELVDKYAEDLLIALSAVEYTVTYTHGYCPVRLGDCVRLNYTRAGINNVKAKVIRQNIRCETGCPVSETAVFISKLWNTDARRVTYDANGGVGGPDDQTKWKNQSLTLSTTIPTRKGYEFVKWATTRTLIEGTEYYESGAEYTKNERLTLYAVWKEVEVSE